MTEYLHWNDWYQEEEMRDKVDINTKDSCEEEIIRVDHITKDYGDGKGVFDFNFKIKKGEVYGLVGTNGSGKTTTMRQLMGFLRPDEGECSIFGIPAWERSYKYMNRIGYVPGEIDFPDVGSGSDFLKLQAQFLGIKDTEDINELIDLFKIDVSAGLKRMSKGMKQKTALVAAFMGRPDVLLLDEPSTGLDPLMRDTLIELILREKKRGCTIFMSSHIFKELDDTCDRVGFIHNGRFIEEIESSVYSDREDKRYRIGFETDEKFRSFMEANPFDVESYNPKYRHVVIRVASGQAADANTLMKILANYSVRYMKYIPYTLEDYYMENIESRVS